MIPGLEQWAGGSVAVQVLGLFCLTFLLEDAATVGAAVLLGHGALSWSTAFWPCFTGVWLGDVGLYAVARYGGRRWFEQTRAGRRAHERLVRSEAWIRRRGLAVVLLSRALPGTRLPTYVASGFLRLPLAGFLAVTAGASIAWTAGILALGREFGPVLAQWLGQYRETSAGALVGVAALGGLWWGTRRFRTRRIQVSAVDSSTTVPARDAIPWRPWEFWPMWLFYPPVVGYCLWLALRFRGLTLPVRANPGIFAGGVVGESKVETLRQLMALCPEYTAAAELIHPRPADEHLRAAKDLMRVRGWTFPVVLKPDVGQRGAGFRVVRSDEELRSALQRSVGAMVLQEYAPGPVELGVFYVRRPDESTGRIWAITEKVFPEIVGDGRSTLEELIRADNRARHLASVYLRRWHQRRRDVLAAGERLSLVQAGNHAQGCVFRDGMPLWTAKLEERIDAISRSVPGFFVGRYDLRGESLAAIRQGEGFKIVELNGAAAEATSIYDARYSLAEAYRTLFRQWRLVFEIGAMNRERGAPGLSWRILYRRWRECSRGLRNLPVAD